MKFLNKLGNLFYCENKWVLLLTIVISTVLPLLVGWGAWVHFPHIFDQIAKYSDLVAGSTTWSGYFKRGDLIMFNIYFASYVALLIMLPIILNRLFKLRRLAHKKNKYINEVKQVQQNNKMVSEATFFLLAFGAFGATVLLLNRTFPLAAVFAFLTCLYLILNGQDENLNKIFAKFSTLAGNEFQLV